MKIGEVIKTLYGVNTDVALVSPADSTHGDLTTNVCMQVSKNVGKSPEEVSKDIITAIEGEEVVDSVVFAKPGFINITLTGEARMKLVQASWKACKPQEKRDEAPVIVEYSHPNIAKPLGVHHVLSTVIGQAISNLYRHQGYPVVSWNYIGDWGTQFGKLAVALEKWGDKSKKTSDYTLQELLDLYVKFHDEAEKDASLEEEARAAFRRLEEGDKDIRAFWKDVVEISLKGLDELYERLHVSFDVTKGESSYEDVMSEIIKEGKEKGIFVEGEDGALIVEFDDESLPVYMIVKSDGGTLYSTRDLALALDRKKAYKPQSVLHVVDVAQQTYFRQLFATMEKLGWDMDHEEHVVYGRMSFEEKGMSTRKGNMLKLEDALDEAVKRADKLIEEKESEVKGSERDELAEMMGVSSFVYTILSQNRKHNIVFTWDKALTFEGNSAPYLQYTHARAMSVLRKGKCEGRNAKCEEDNFAFITSHFALDPVKEISPEAQELQLMRRIILFPSVLEDARRDAMPHKLTNYLYSLCQDYNAFYNALPILDSKDPVRSLRLALTGITSDILKAGAEILTLRVPDRM